jgi:hypothetical protein
MRMVADRMLTVSRETNEKALSLSLLIRQPTGTLRSMNWKTKRESKQEQSFAFDQRDPW